MTSEEKGEFAELLLQHLNSGREFNDNQAEMLLAMGTSRDAEPYEIGKVLRDQIKKNPPRHCLTPGL